MTFCAFRSSPLLRNQSNAMVVALLALCLAPPRGTGPFPLSAAAMLPLRFLQLDRACGVGSFGLLF